MPKRPHLNNTNRFLFVWLYRWFPSVPGAFAIVRPETIIRWHRAGFRAYWRWRSRPRLFLLLVMIFSACECCDSGSFAMAFPIQKLFASFLKKPKEFSGYLL